MASDMLQDFRKRGGRRRMDKKGGEGEKKNGDEGRGKEGRRRGRMSVEKE